MTRERGSCDVFDRRSAARIAGADGRRSGAAMAQIGYSGTGTGDDQA